MLKTRAVSFVGFLLLAKVVWTCKLYHLVSATITMSHINNLKRHLFSRSNHVFVTDIADILFM